MIHEVLDDWWLGMLKDGRKGLFPTNYTIPITSGSTRPLAFAHEDGRKNGAARNDDHDGAEARDDGSISYHGQPMDVPHSATSFGFDVDSIISVTEDDESQHLVPPRRSISDEALSEGPPRTGGSPPLPRRKTSPEIPSMVVGRKAPPPPPPRRAQTSTLPPPLIPERPAGPSKNRLVLQPGSSASSASSSSSYASPVYLTPTSSMKASDGSGGGNGHSGPNVSPFDSLTDLSTNCAVFRQLVNERKGMCANCLRVH